MGALRMWLGSKLSDWGRRLTEEAPSAIAEEVDGEEIGSRPAATLSAKARAMIEPPAPPVLEPKSRTLPAGSARDRIMAARAARGG